MKFIEEWIEKKKEQKSVRVSLTNISRRDCDVNISLAECVEKL
jgi:hypothetical protein